MTHPAQHDYTVLISCPDNDIWRLYHITASDPEAARLQGVRLFEEKVFGSEDAPVFDTDVERYAKPGHAIVLAGTHRDLLPGGIANDDLAPAG